MIQLPEEYLLCRVGATELAQGEAEPEGLSRTASEDGDSMEAFQRRPSSSSSIGSVGSTASLRARLRSNSILSHTPSRREKSMASSPAVSINSVFSELREERTRRLQAQNEKLLEDERTSDFDEQFQALTTTFCDLLSSMEPSLQDLSMDRQASSRPVSL